jgi:hypothetical protein
MAKMWPRTEREQFGMESSWAALPGERAVLGLAGLPDKGLPRQNGDVILIARRTGPVSCPIVC